jgi:polyhydroxyalkanoate synthesis regulator phasin
MIDLIKKTMLAGIGATAITKEKVESLLGEYVEKGKLSAQDAKSMADRIVADGRQEYEQVRHDLGVRFNEMLKKSNFATREELDAFEKRLAALEHKAHEHKTAPEHKAAAHAHKEN